MYHMPEDFSLAIKIKISNKGGEVGFTLNRQNGILRLTYKCLSKCQAQNF